MKPPPPVLGLFQNEAELRDHVAARLSDLEPGLERTQVEYRLDNPAGAGGQIDILALDEFDHVVVIELKRSDQSTRSTLNELAKYICLLVEQARTPREAIRCLVLSTDWHELRLPLSFFAATAGVHIEGRRIVRDGDGLAYEPVELTPITHLPQFSPEISLYQYRSAQDRETHLASIREHAGQAPFLRLAVLSLDAPSGAEITPFRTIVCIWRVRTGEDERLAAITGNPVGWLEPYGFPGWEAECDALYWICDEVSPTVLFSSAEEQRGTPEKVRNLLFQYRTAGVERLGDWPKVDLINTDARILHQLEAVSSLVSGERPNRFSFHQTVSPRFAPSWRHAVDRFLSFIAFEPVWASAARDFLASLAGSDAKVTLQAMDKNHFFYALHQARVHANTDLSHFAIAVDRGTGEHDGISGHYVWNGAAPPRAAAQAMERTFGSLGWATMALFSAVDSNRYDAALVDHGFEPVVLRLRVSATGATSIEDLVGSRREGGGLQDFVGAHSEFVDDVSALFGDLPTSPRAISAP